MYPMSTKQAVSPITLDFMDAPIWEAFDNHQALPDHLRAKLYQVRFWADPKLWNKHKPRSWVFSLQWHQFQYSRVKSREDLRQLIQDNSPGIYCFVIMPDQMIDGLHPQYVMYVGISNQGDSQRSLKDRIADYLPCYMSKIKKRKSVHRFLTYYYPSIWVKYAFVANPSKDLEAAEKELHGYLAPPVGDRDYPIDMKPYKPAFGS